MVRLWAKVVDAMTYAQWIEHGTSLSDRMIANTEAGFPVCTPGTHEWFGSFGSHICAVCLILSEDLITVRSLRDGFRAMAEAALEAVNPE